MDTHTPIIAICGPTGVGKTDFVDILADRFPIEIINMDVGQLYQELTIGTAKPAWRTHPVTHHLFDSIATPTDTTVALYRKNVAQLISEIRKRNRIPVLVGGSLFYLKSLLFQVQEGKTIPLFDQTDNPKTLWALLNDRDPIRAQAIGPTDVYRLQRALALLQSGYTPSECAPLYNPIAPSIVLFLNRNRADLYERINARTDVMMQQGWLQEVRGLTPDWWAFLKRKRLIGYNELIDYLQDEETQSLDMVIEKIKQRTRNYAKKQICFWRSLREQVEENRSTHHYFVEMQELDLTLTDLGLYLNQLKNKLFPIRDQ